MKSKFFYILFSVILISHNLFAQEKPTLTVDDYKKWESLIPLSISRDGNWIAYTITLNEGNDTLFIKNSQTDSVYKEAFASGIQFSADSRWAAYRIGVSQEKREKMQEKKEEVHYKLGMLNLDTGEKTIYKEVSSF